jgi:two-component system sensor histidine kinase/response regulator
MERKPKILIVDDNEENLSVSGNLLMNEGYTIQIASNWEQAIQVAQRKSPDLILLDISMPEKTGYEVCEILKADPQTSTIPIIFLTALTEIKNIVQGFELGAVDYITKPFNEAELLARVKTHIQLQKAQAELHEKNLQLELSNAAKNKFFSIIAHDLRSPFSALIGLSDVAMDNMKRERYEQTNKYLAAIRKSSQKGLGLIDNLLHWARIQTGRMSKNPILIKVPEIIRNVVELLQPNLAEKSIKLSLNLEKDIAIMADKFMLETVMRNLISNAIKFTKDFGFIQVVARQEGDILFMSVQDNGVGMSQDSIDDLFIIDKTFSTQGTRNEEGSGLGLLLCKEFVEAHHGQIWVESTEGEGTKFTFSFVSESLHEAVGKA